MKRTLLCISALAFAGAEISAQSNTVTTGGQANGTGGTASYSIGQIDYITCTGTGGIITEGNQQPYEILIIDGVDETAVEMNAIVYPNPTADFVTLSTGSMPVDNMRYEVYDLLGNLLMSKKVDTGITTIELQELAQSTYFIKVMQDNKEIKTFKIIKNI